MSSSTTFRVPEGMSCVNAFHALWINSKPAAFFTDYPSLLDPQVQSVNTAKKVAELFKTQTYFNYEGGRMLKMEFAAFPELDGRSYDRDFGLGAAQKAIEAYNRVDPSERFDQYDSYKFEELKSYINALIKSK